MNRNKLKTYAPKARRDFIAAVTARAAKFGITAKKVEPVRIQGEVALIGSQAHPKKVAEQRAGLEARINIRGFEQVMEEAAYTWFNRFAAIRFMELHGYLDHGYRVLSHPEGKAVPEILEHAQHLDLPGLDAAAVLEMKLDGTKDPELYRLLLRAQCNALHAAMPFLFERIDDETELLLPDNLLHSDSVIRQMVDEIEEADWQEIEIIGWLYQFYISEKKDEVIGKVVKSEDIPAATQLFTPNWIVKYMVQNTLGAKWLATYPQSGIRTKMAYYIEPAQQTDEVRAKLAEITPKDLNPEEITFLDPACGSGHILVEAYDLFKEIYLERGYVLREIPRLILGKNLFGLDIDDRAAQMACFALLMKAREDDRRILVKAPELNVMAIQESKGLDAKEMSLALAPPEKIEANPVNDLFPNTLARLTVTNNKDIKVISNTIHAIIELFCDAKTHGSLIIPTRSITDDIKELSVATSHYIGSLENKTLFSTATAHIEELSILIKQYKVLAKNFDCIVANPPYMGGRGMMRSIKSFAEIHYSTAKGDLFACFIQKALSMLTNDAYFSMITIEAWMFLSSFEEFRKNLLARCTIRSLCHFPYEGKSPTALGINFGVCAFVITNNKIRKFQGSYTCSRHYELNEFGVPYNFPTPNERLKSLDSDLFLKVPGGAMPYWVGDGTINAYGAGQLLSEIADPKQGLATADNATFVRHWSEVDIRTIGFNIADNNAAALSGAKWFPYNKGGDFRKWYGNRDFVVNWAESGKDIKNFIDENGKQRSRPQNIDYYFREGATWSFISSAYFGVRWTPSGSIFDVGGSSIFPDIDDIPMVVSLLCSKVAHHYLKAVNPTLNFQVGNVGSIPFLRNKLQNDKDRISILFSDATAISKADWDSIETSWDFAQSPLLMLLPIPESVIISVHAWINCCRLNKASLKNIEHQNNDIFITAYDLFSELSPEVELRHITLIEPTESESIRQLVSYAVGCMMGRYSLDESGIIYADSGNVGFDPSRYVKFPADDDGIVPIMQTDWFEDDATVRFTEFLKVAWSPETLAENLKFVANSLGPKSGETATDTVRRYFSSEFFKEHLKTYKKRPIYWLFSSGKEKAFEALVYLHRYNEGTLSRMRMEYVTPLQGRIANRVEQLGRDLDATSGTAARNKLAKELEKLKKQQAELRRYDEELRHYADMRIKIDLDDGVKVNYGKFGNLLAEVKAITGGSDE